MIVPLCHVGGWSRPVHGRTGARLACVLALVLLAGPAESARAVDEPAPGGSWRTGPAAPTKRTEVAAAALKGRLYVIGGFSEPTVSNIGSLAITDAVELYDPAAGRWSAVPPLPAKLHHAAAAVVGDRLYVVGGFSRSFLSVWEPVASLFIYDPAEQQWREGAPMPTARGALAVATWQDQLFAIGGYGESGNTGAVERFDPGANRWTQAAPLPTPRDHLAAATIGDRIYAIGGRLERNYGKNLAVVHAYDPTRDRWEPVADMPTPRSGMTAAAVGGMILVTGGEAPAGTFNATEAYVPATNRWTRLPSMPTARHGLGSAVIDQEWYVASGGPTPGGSFSNVLEIFTPLLATPAADGSSTPRSRASSPQVGSAMAVLATLQDSGVLPPEGTKDADRVIRSVIQFQALFTKSDHPAVRDFFTRALEAKVGPAAAEAAARFMKTGWTSDVLEAVVDHGASLSEQDWNGFRSGLEELNLSRKDFAQLSDLVVRARTALARQGKTLGEVYAQRRREMPGASF